MTASSSWELGVCAGGGGWGTWLLQLSCSKLSGGSFPSDKRSQQSMTANFATFIIINYFISFPLYTQEIYVSLQ